MVTSCGPGLYPPGIWPVNVCCQQYLWLVMKPAGPPKALARLGTEFLGMPASAPYCTGCLQHLSAVVGTSCMP